jgi:hypothetical protein
MVETKNAYIFVGKPEEGRRQIGLSVRVYRTIILMSILC